MTREMAALVVANFVTQEQALAEIRRIVVELKALQLRLKVSLHPAITRNPLKNFSSSSRRTPRQLTPS